MLVGMREVFCFKNTINQKKKKKSHKKLKSRKLCVEENTIAHFSCSIATLTSKK